MFRRLSTSVRGALCGLAAASLFGVSAPAAKLLLPSMEPLVLAALLYLGAGLGLVLTGLAVPKRVADPPLSRKDLPLLAGVIVFGGVTGPVLMLVGLAQVSGVSGSLLLNLEGPFTVLLALLLFGEHLGVRGLVGAGLVFGGATWVGLRPGELRADPQGVLAIAGACLAWGLDNNLSQRLSLKNPLTTVRIKALTASAGMLCAAVATGRPFPHAKTIVGALVLGAFSYGLSILLDMYALRWVGAAREAAYFATAPFIGSLVAVPLLGESLGWAQGLAFGVMGLGMTVLLRDRHGHLHTHEALEHEHLHVHDEHHRHAHDGPVFEPHSHFHRHATIVHDHPHASDLHHRHRH